MPQVASAGSASGSTASATGEIGDSGFLAMFAMMMGSGTTDPVKTDDSGEPAAEAGAKDATAVPDGMLGLIAPGLLSNLMIQPQGQVLVKDAAPTDDGALA